MSQQVDENEYTHDVKNMMKALLVEDVMGSLLVVIKSAESKYLEKAENIIAEYWLWIDESNKALKEAKKQVPTSGDTINAVKKKMAYAGPKIEKMQSGTGNNKRIKNRIIWSSYEYSPMRLKSGTPKTNSSVKFSQMGKRIKMSANKEYGQRTLVRHSVNWDAARMVETEKKLMPIRERLEALHKLKVELTKADRRIDRITKQYEGEMI